MTVRGTLRSRAEVRAVRGTHLETASLSFCIWNPPLFVAKWYALLASKSANIQNFYLNFGVGAKKASKPSTGVWFYAS